MFLLGDELSFFSTSDMGVRIKSGWCVTWVAQLSHAWPAVSSWLQLNTSFAWVPLCEAPSPAFAVQSGAYRFTQFASLLMRDVRHATPCHILIFQLEWNVIRHFPRPEMSTARKLEKIEKSEQPEQNVRISHDDLLCKNHSAHFINERKSQNLIRNQ